LDGGLGIETLAARREEVLKPRGRGRSLAMGIRLTKYVDQQILRRIVALGPKRKPKDSRNREDGANTMCRWLGEQAVKIDLGGFGRVLVETGAKLPRGCESV
jgi:hypothetical protein